MKIIFYARFHERSSAMRTSLRALGLGALAGSASGFVAAPMGACHTTAPAIAPRTVLPPTLSFMQPPAGMDCEEEECALPSGIYVNDVLVSGETLRSMELLDARGSLTRASSIIGDEGSAVVIFLRHLG
tara:strand:- start:2960 stop:3346 length:387 start_codon:yes stop_codon:yes gene_type:complete